MFRLWRDAIAKTARRATPLAFAALLWPPTPALADCDGAREEVALAGFNENFEIKFEDGRTARLAGLELPSPGHASPATLAKAAADLKALTDLGVAFFVPL